MKKIKTIIISLLLACISFFSFVITPFNTSYTLTASAESVMEFEQNGVLKDLENSLINGEEFSLKNYNFDTTKNTQVISFLEYSYSFYESLQGNFGLYVYVYNPQGLKFVVNSSLHSISFKIGENESESYKKYPLSVLNFSQETDYYGLFYKLKVVLTDEEKQDILSKLNSTERVYSVSEIELMEEGQTNATPVAAQGIYKFSGYMSGFGSNSSAENTLKCMNEQMETLHLEPHATAYRPEGTNGKNDYTQDSLHSVYFAVPNKFIELYGEMTAVHATWLNAVLKPALVTGNQEAFAAINNFLGVQVYSSGNSSEDVGAGDGIGGGGGGGRSISTVAEASTDTLEYMYLGASEMVSAPGMGSVYYFNCGYRYNVPTSWVGEMGGSCSADPIYYGSEVNPLYMLFNAGSGEDSADNYTVQSEDIYATLKDSATNYGGDLVNGKYAACMFESVDSEFTEMNIRRDDEYDLTSETITQNWWQKLWGTGTVVSTTFDGIKAIYNVSDSDFTGDIEADCNNLYIGSQDYTDFKQYYEDNKTDSTVYLFRYQVSDYISQEATLFENGSYLGITTRKEVDTNAYFFQETVNLDFDIIDVTFSTGETETVIPVVMKPIDVIPDATPPVYTESDQKEWWEKLVALLLLVVLLVILMPILTLILGTVFGYIFKGFGVIIGVIFNILTFPLRLIGKLFTKK